MSVDVSDHHRVDIKERRNGGDVVGWRRGGWRNINVCDFEFSSGDGGVDDDAFEGAVIDGGVDSDEGDGMMHKSQKAPSPSRTILPDTEVTREGGSREVGFEFSFLYACYFHVIVGEEGGEFR